MLQLHRPAHALAGCCALLSCAAFMLAPVAGADDRPQTGHRYELHATLDPEAHTVQGTARITWRNNASTPAAELWFHLYLNAFASRDTVFMRESSGRMRGVTSTGRGRIDVHALRVENGASLLGEAELDVVPGDATQMRVPLPAPVPPGASIVLRCRFTSHLPPVFARSGYAGRFHAVAQWFPKLAVRERDGQWVSFPYRARGEFYADFARYELTIVAPSPYVVAATGTRERQRILDNGKTEHRFVADPVHDAAFVAWDRFETLAFKAADVDVRLLYPPGYRQAAEVHAEVVRQGLAHFGRLFGAYPYATLSVVVPPRGAEGAAGMEYPTLFVTAGPWWSLPFVYMPGEVVTAHELAHQWFQGLIANDEVRWPMLDEGLAQWATAELMRERHGEPGSAIGWPIDVSYFDGMRHYAYGGRATPPPASAAPEFTEEEYGRAVYARTALVLETVGRVWGRGQLIEALGRYSREQRFGHPVPADLFGAFDDVYGPDFSPSVLEPALMGGQDSELVLDGLQSEREGDEYVTRVDGRRVGSLPVPTQVELRYADGGRTRLPWPAAQRELSLVHRSHAVVVGAVADPDGRLLLDRSVQDNAVGAREPGARTSVGALLLFLVQHLLGLGGT